jgi:hypothetical protein
VATWFNLIQAKAFFLSVLRFEIVTSMAALKVEAVGH